ncbi:MAG: cation diffusion facilitator family transporter [Bacteroides sp.]|nr:cation diffusion facilitator family transporter [Bacteroides sp.]
MGTEQKSHKKRSHHHHHPVNEKNLLVATLLNLVITIVQVAGSILSGSIALLSDALHNLSDTFATFIAYMANRIGKRDANPKKTFGYKRIEILSALLNAVILIVMSVFLVLEAYKRLYEPREVNSMIMIVVAMIGLLANLFAASILKKDAHKSINVKAAYMHLVGDALTSLLVVIGGVLIRFLGIHWIDSLLTIVISLYIVREGFIILKEALNILMQSAPDHLDIQEIKKGVEALPEINNMHHIHTWMLTDQQIHLEAHIELDKDLKLSEVDKIRQKLNSFLHGEFNIQHITLQFEFDSGHPPQVISQEE